MGGRICLSERKCYSAFPLKVLYRISVRGVSSPGQSPLTGAQFVMIYKMTDYEFEKITAQAVRDLPLFFRDKLDNVAVIVRASPTKEQERKLGTGLLGLYEGVPLSARGMSYSGAMPDKITIFKKNVEAVCPSEAEIIKEVKHVVIHEIAHHFGIDDERLLSEGLY